MDIGKTLGAGARQPEQPGPSQLVDRQGHGRRFADREGRATAWGDRRYDDLAALAARQDRRTDRRLTIDILVREARRGTSQGRKPVAVQLRHLLPAPPLAVLDPRFPPIGSTACTERVCTSV